MSISPYAFGAEAPAKMGERTLCVAAAVAVVGVGALRYRSTGAVSNLLGAAGAGGAMIYLDIPRTHLVNESPLVAAAVPAALVGWAAPRMVSATLATREGKVMALLASAGVLVAGKAVSGLTGAKPYNKA